MTKKGKEKQLMASDRTLLLQIKESGRKMDEIEVPFSQLPNRFGLVTDLFSMEVLEDSHSEGVKKAKKLRIVNEFIRKHI